MVGFCFEDYSVGYISEVRAVTPHCERLITLMLMESLWKAGTALDIIYVV